MFLGSNTDVTKLSIFLSGFNGACKALGYKYDEKIEQQVYEEYSYEQQADGVLSQLRTKGLDEKAIIQEIVRLELEKWKKLRDFET